MPCQALSVPPPAPGGTGKLGTIEYVPDRRLLAVTVGLVFVAGGMALGAGRAIPTGFGWSDELRGVWSVVRWPVGVVVIAVAILLLFRFAPKVSLGPWRYLFAGTVVAVVLWVAFTGLLSLYFSLSSDSSPYGPLLSIVALT
jgi:uncharacterized BrkB/YihY/UPF0761 family membrane protein